MAADVIGAEPDMAATWPYRDDPRRRFFARPTHHHTQRPTRSQARHPTHLHPTQAHSLQDIMAVVPKPEPEDTVLPPAPAPAPAPPPAHTKSSKPDPAPKTRADALKEISGVRRVTAWSIHRWPLEKRVVQERTRVHLPRTYRARHGADVRTVFPGTDLNQFVHGHYMEVMGAEREGAGVRKAGAKGRESEREKRAREEWPNYVAGEAVLAKR